MKTKTLLVDVVSPHASKADADAKLSELKSLVYTLGGMNIVHTLQRKSDPDYQTYIGGGTIDEAIRIAESKEIKILIVNNLLKPRQIFTLGETLRPHGVEVWDRIDLILNIFSQHAQSAEAKLQIELARIRHMGPRIFDMGIELSRQGGGIGTSGIGETNIERMKRHLKEQERRIVKKLEKIEQGHDLQRQRRRRENFFTVSLIGYTNAGKSTLMRVLTKKENVAVHDALFVTLDTRIGKLFLPRVLKSVLVSDTIGFIADLPPELIAAFTSTLSETIHSDLLLHVGDVSDPRREEKIAVVDGILENLGIADKPQILVGNKVDIAGKRFGKLKLRLKYKDRSPVFLSATEKENIEELKNIIAKKLFPNEKPYE